MEDRVLALGEIAWDVLQRMVRELLARKAGAHLVESSLEAIDLSLALELKGSRADPRAFSEQLAATLDAILDDAIEHAAAFRPGLAFCHRCEGAACEHAVPPSSRHVFIGYAPTGMPRWEDFAQICLDRRHPSVDRLYEESPAFLTLIEGARPLTASLVDAFHAQHRYQLLGQVTAGFYAIRPRAGEGREVLAVTFQVAASRSRDGKVRLGLNILGRTPSGEPLGLLWERQDEIPWRLAVRWAQTALQSIVSPGGTRAGRSRGVLPEALDRRVDGVLRGLARRLERDHRARRRRTFHAEERHLAGDRPTRKAHDDLRQVRAEEVLFDERHKTWVVPGDRGRTHFFSADGRLVSSVRYSRDAIERKLKLALWRPAEAAEAASLLEKLRQHREEDA